MQNVSRMLLTALLLVTSCGGPSIKVALPVPVCPVPAWPDDPTVELAPACAPDAVCLTVPSAKELYAWIRKIRRIHEAISGCPPVQESP